MPEEKKCFVIMPITTPASMVEKYPGGGNHFHHVYECLFKPSIVKAGYSPIPPKAEGSDMIHAEIIGNLESADLVLCDMSCLNPNAFFEWGIRTALNKPVCVVKDELTTNVPFDVGTLNYHEYSSTMHGWDIEAEREKLAAHLTASATKAGDDNALWKHFGLSSKGQPYQVREGSGGRLDYIVMQIESMRRRIDDMADSRRLASKVIDVGQPSAGGNPPMPRVSASQVRDFILRSFGASYDVHVEVWRTPHGNQCIRIRSDPTWTRDMTKEIVTAVDRAFKAIRITGTYEPDDMHGPWVCEEEA